MSHPIFEAITTGDLEALQRMLREDAKAVSIRNEVGISSIMIALYHRADAAVDMLLATDPPLDLFEAAALGRRQRLAEFLAHDSELVAAEAPDGFTALHLACFFGQPETVDLLLEAGADPNAVASNPTQVRPLHSAAAGRSCEIISLLLRHEASVNARQQGGWTALHSAAQHDDLDMVRLLLEHGADPQQAADDGITALDLAREHGTEALIALLGGR